MVSLLGSSRRPDISFYASGRIDITSHVARLLGIASGDVIDVGMEKGEYFFYVRAKGAGTMGRHEAQCWQTKKGSKNYRAYSKRLCKAVMQLSGARTVARLPIGCTALIHGGGTKAVILIARNNLSDS